MKIIVKTFIIFLLIICLITIVIGFKEVSQMAQIIGSRGTTSSLDALRNKYKDFVPRSNLVLLQESLNKKGYNPTPYTSGVIGTGNVGSPQGSSFISTAPSSSSGGGISSGSSVGKTSSASSGSSGGSSVSGFPTYQVPQVNLNIPDFNWDPTEEQRAGYLEQGSNRANLIIDPQKQAEIEALEKFKQDVTSQISNINPRYTKMSLAIANMVDNTIKQDIIDELTRRGATTSGEMERQLASAGRYEVEQRSDIEGERNQLINALNTGQQQRGELSSSRLAELERLRGMQTAEETFQEEKYQRGMSDAEKESLFGAELSQAQMINSQQAQAYESQYNKALFDAQMNQQNWERSQTERQMALSQANSAYSQGNQADPYQDQSIALRTAQEKRDAFWDQYARDQLSGGTGTGTSYGGFIR